MTDTTLTIRAATAADLEGIVPLWIELQNIHVDHHPCWTADDADGEEYREALAAVLDHPETVLRVAVETGGKVVGYCHGSAELQPATLAESRVGRFHGVFVIPSARDGGVGSALVAAVLDVLRGTGVSRVEATASAENDGAIRFLERARFGLHTVTLGHDL